MLYEAVYWRASVDRPSLAEALASPDVSSSLADWGQRDGDTAVVALSDSLRVGAAWYRYWTDDSTIRGYLDESTPVVVIGVHRDFRHRGIGTQMLQWLIGYAFAHSIERLSLMVSKDNHALNLYEQQGFVESAEKGNSFLMVCTPCSHRLRSGRATGTSRWS